LQITPTRVQEGELTDASASGAGMVTANHSDVWLAFINKRAVRLTLDDGPTFEARIQKITQLTDGRVAVGLGYQMHSTESERFAISVAYGSSDQLQKNRQRCQHRKNSATVFLILLRKALVLGCGHLFFLFRHMRKSPSTDQSTPRLLWEKKNETSSIYFPGDVGTVSRDELADRVIRPSRVSHFFRRRGIFIDQSRLSGPHHAHDEKAAY
jgi:hypothetical protein